MSECEWRKSCDHCDHQSGHVYGAGYQLRTLTCCHCGRTWEQSTPEHTGTWAADPPTSHGPHAPIVTVTL